MFDSLRDGLYKSGKLKKFFLIPISIFVTFIFLFGTSYFTLKKGDFNYKDENYSEAIKFYKISNFSSFGLNSRAKIRTEKALNNLTEEDKKEPLDFPTATLVPTMSSIITSPSTFTTTLIPASVLTLYPNLTPTISLANDMPLVITSVPASSFSDKYTTIIKLSDSKGNVNLQSEYNNVGVIWFQPWPRLKVGDMVTFMVDVNNPVADPVQYEFVGNGFPNVWQTENKVTVTINSQTFDQETIHLRVFVKNSDSQFRAPDYDDMIQVFYTKVD